MTGPLFAQSLQVWAVVQTGGWDSCMLHGAADCMQKGKRARGDVFHNAGLTGYMVRVIWVFCLCTVSYLCRRAAPAAVPGAAAQLLLTI